MKRKYADVNLNQAPTLKDFEVAKKIADIAMDHATRIAEDNWDGKYLTDKIAQIIKDFRVANRKKKKN